MDSLQAGWLQAVANAQASGSSPAAPRAEVKQEMDDTATGHGIAEPVRFLTTEDLEEMRRELRMRRTAVREEKMRRDMQEKQRSQLATKEAVDFAQQLRRMLAEKKTEIEERGCTKHGSKQTEMHQTME